MKNCTVLSAMAIAVLFSATIWAGPAGYTPPGNLQGYSAERGHRFTEKMLRMMIGLDLSQEQREQIWAIVDESRPQMREHRLALLEGRGELHQIMSTGEYDEATVRALAELQGEVIAGLIILQAEIWQRVYSVLTPEQQAGFEDWRSQGRGQLLAQ